MFLCFPSSFLLSSSFSLSSFSSLVVSFISYLSLLPFLQMAFAVNPQISHSCPISFPFCYSFVNYMLLSVCLSSCVSACVFVSLSICVQWRPAIPDVKGPTNFICYWRIFVIANIKNNKAGYTAQDAPSMRSFHLRK